MKFSFSDCLISLSIMFSRSIYAVAKGKLLRYPLVKGKGTNFSSF